MNQTLSVSLIVISIAASPGIYLLGKRMITQWVSLSVLAVEWVVYALVLRDFHTNGATTFNFSDIALHVDGLTLLFTGLVLLISTLVMVSAGVYRRRDEDVSLFYASVLLLSGAMIGLASAADLFNLWLWFEMLVIGSYLLVAFYRSEPAPLLASMNYLVQSAVGSVMVLFGIALVLAETGTLSLTAIAAEAGESRPIQVASVLFVTGFGVKSALIPLHTWLPDAYAVAPSNISALLASTVTAAGLIAMLRVLVALDPAGELLGLILIGAGAANIVLGNLMAFRQKEIKRLLAYSSLPHIGFMSLGLGISLYTNTPDGAQATWLHLFNHGLMKGLAFMAVGALIYGLRTSVSGRSIRRTSDLAGAINRYPFVTLALCIAVLGLASVPPLAGFFSMFQILKAGLTTGYGMLQVLVIILALNELVALGYYLPVVNTLTMQEPSPVILAGKPMKRGIQIPLVVLALLIVIFGIKPDWLMWLLETGIPGG